MLAFDQALDEESVPGAASFTVSVGGASRGVSDVSVSGNTVTLRLTSPAVSGETVTVGYTVPTGENASPLRGTADDSVAAFSAEAVTNDTPSEVLVGIYSLSGDWSEARDDWAVYLVRYGDTAAELTVNASVTETGAMLNGTPPSTFTFPAGSDEIQLTGLSEDDLIDEPDSEVTIKIEAGAGYRTSEELWGGPSVVVTVLDDDWSPEITTPSLIEVSENRLSITTLTANRRVYASAELSELSEQSVSRGQVSWSLVGGADADKVTLSTGGELAFKTAKDFEAPDDAGADGDYEIEVRVTDAAGNSADASLTIRLTDMSANATGKPAISDTVPQVGRTLIATRGHDRRRRRRARHIHLPVGPGGRQPRERHFQCDIEQLHAERGGRGQADQGEDALHRRRGQ